jgi:hypothetical protein
VVRGLRVSPSLATVLMNVVSEQPICDVQNNRKEDMFLKQHRKANLQLDGRKLTGDFEVSLTNQGDREVITEFVNEIRKQLREFDPDKPKKKKRVKKYVR